MIAWQLRCPLLCRVFSWHKSVVTSDSVTAAWTGRKTYLNCPGLLSGRDSEVLAVFGLVAGEGEDSLEKSTDKVDEEFHFVSVA
jgi:hypothetical protein